MDKKELAKEAVRLLEIEYPDATCTLTYKEPWQLLVAVRLAAQCTDARVDMVTPALFEKYKSIEELAKAEVTDIENMVKSCGFYHSKAKDICSMAKMLKEKYDGIVPDTMEELLKLPGVGRKSANLVLGDIYHKEAVVCDTHCIRITNLLGLTNTKDPAKCEVQLRAILDLSKSSDFCHRLVLHGRKVCVARRPNCKDCCLKNICTSYT